MQAPAAEFSGCAGGLASLQHVWLFFARRWVVFRLA
jgi:hypothetical protein